MLRESLLLLAVAGVTACGANIDVGGPRLGSDSSGGDSGSDIGSGSGSGSGNASGSGSGGGSAVGSASGSGATFTTDGGASSGDGMGDAGSSPTGVDPGSTTVEPYSGSFKVLVLSKTLDFSHDSIADCQNLLSTLGQTPDAMMPSGAKPGSQFTVDIAKSDLSDFTDDNLKSYAMLFWCNPTGTVFSSGGPNGTIGMAAIQKFMEGGGAWGGVHSATDFEKTNGFPWFTNTLLGGYFDHHDADGTIGTVRVESAFASHPVMRGVPTNWNTQDEWYYMNRDVSVQPGFQIISRLASDNRPVVWLKELGADQSGRMFYTTRGHNKSVYKEPDFKRLILNGILWATHRLN